MKSRRAIALITGVVGLSALIAKFATLQSYVNTERPFAINGISLDMVSESVLRELGSPIRKVECKERSYGQRCYIWLYRDCALKLMGDRWVRGIRGTRLGQDERTVLQVEDSEDKVRLLLGNKTTLKDGIFTAECIFWASAGVMGPKTKPAYLSIGIAHKKVDTIRLTAPDCSLEELELR